MATVGHQAEIGTLSSAISLFAIGSNRKRLPSETVAGQAERTQNAAETKVHDHYEIMITYLMASHAE
jgi:hypothetical protein